VLLTRRNIDTHLAHIRSTRERYRKPTSKTSPESKPWREVAKTKHCKSTQQ